MEGFCINAGCSIAGMPEELHSLQGAIVQIHPRFFRNLQDTYAHVLKRSMQTFSTQRHVSRAQTSTIWVSDQRFHWCRHARGVGAMRKRLRSMEHLHSCGHPFRGIQQSVIS